jgi:hypothetical protein
MSRDSSVGIETDYGLDDRMIWVRMPARAGNFSLHHRVQNGSGAHPASYPMGTKGSFLGGNAAGREADLRLMPRSKNVWSYISTPPYAFMAWYLVKHRDRFTFTFIYITSFDKQLHILIWRSCNVTEAEKSVAFANKHLLIMQFIIIITFWIIKVSSYCA